MFLFVLGIAWSHSLFPEEAVLLTLNHHPSVKAAELSVLGAERNESIAALLPAPTLQLQLSPAAAVDERSLVASVSIQQHIYGRDKRLLLTEQAVIQSSQSEAELRLEKQRLQRTVLEHYQNWLYSSRLIQSTEEHQAVIETSLKLLQIRSAAGEQQSAELLAAESQLALLEQQKLEQQRHLLRHQAFLCGFIGAEPCALQPPSELLFPSLETGESKRAELQLAVQKIDEQRLVMELLKEELRPDPTLSLGYSSMMHQPALLVGVGLRLPQHKETKKRIEIAQLELQKAAENKESVVILIESEQRRVDESSLLIRQEIELLRHQTMPILEREKEAAHSAFSAGELPFSRLLQVEHRYILLREQLHRLELESLQLFNDLLWSRGVLLEDIQ